MPSAGFHVPFPTLVYTDLYVPEDNYAIRGQIKVKKGKQKGLCVDSAAEREIETVAILKKCQSAQRTQGTKHQNDKSKTGRKPWSTLLLNNYIVFTWTKHGEIRWRELKSRGVKQG